jgi:hypothetical protein
MRLSKFVMIFPLHELIEKAYRILWDIASPKICGLRPAAACALSYKRTRPQAKGSSTLALDPWLVSLQTS